MSFDRRAAAHRAIDDWFDAHESKLNRSQAAEADRYSHMKRDTDAGKTRYIDTGCYDPRKWPVVSACTMWQIVVNGADSIAGSVRAGYELRHGANVDREAQ
jgi:hypothetical protein